MVSIHQNNMQNGWPSQRFNPDQNILQGLDDSLPGQDWPEQINFFICTRAETQPLLHIHHRWASTSISVSAISDIRHRHLLFRYRRQICRIEKFHSDIESVPISTSEFILISDVEETNFLILQIRTRAPWKCKWALYLQATVTVC
jgi:hypothetical protein